MAKTRIPVLQLIDGFATEEQSGGAAQFGIQLARHLDRERYAPFVCGLWQYGTRSEQRWREQLAAEGIGTAILIEEPRRLGPDMIRAAALLKQLIERIQPQVINSHFERGDLLGLWSKLFDRQHPRIVRTMHADQQWQNRPWLGALVNLLAFPWIFDAEVAISQATREVMDQRLAARLAGRRAVVLYNGISSTLLRPLDQLRTPDHIDRPPRIAIIGRLEPQKGHRYFLEAGAQVLRQIPNLELWIVGAGSLLHDLRDQAAALGITHAVRFLGQRSDIPHILASVDLLVSASIWEGFPTVILEAMAHGVPVVATDVSGSRELVRRGETGMLVPIGDVDALAQAVLHLLGDREHAARMAERAWHQVQQYTIEATAAGYDALYQHLISTP